MENTNKENPNTKINSELVKNLQKFFDLNLDEQIELNYKTKMAMLGKSGLVSSEKEIVINIKAYIYEKNEKGETVAPSHLFENNFYIPISVEQNSEEALQIFTDKLNSCLSDSAKEVS